MLPVSSIVVFVVLALISMASGIEEVQGEGIIQKHSFGEDRVTIDIFVMSKCPDALECESKINEAIEDVKGIVTIRPNYIADIRGHPTTCKHGESECQGDKQQLCIYTYAREDAFWQFLLCHNKNVSAIGDINHADESTYTWPTAAAAADDLRPFPPPPEGDQLLRNNAHKTQEYGVTSSCTIWIDGSSECLTEAKKTVDCDDAGCGDLTRTICARFYETHRFLPHECVGE